MHLPTDALPDDPAAQRLHDRRRVRRGALVSVASVLLLCVVFAFQGRIDVAAWSVTPHALHGMLGLLTAPLLHGSLEHLATNAFSLLLLGTLAGSVYPRATLPALPLIWLGSGLGAWLLGAPGTLQRMPGPFSRAPITSLQAPSTMPPPMSRPRPRYAW